MEYNMIKVSIAAVFMGYEYKSSPTFRDEFGYFIRPSLNGNPTYVWRKTYSELKEYVQEYYGIDLPIESDLHFFNYGKPYNEAWF